jgi:hypothetical protein
VNVDSVRALGIVPKTLEELIVPEMHLMLKGNVLYQGDLALLDILATADWKRPVYVTNTALAQFNVDLTPYVVKEGNTYRILPVLNPNPDNELVNTQKAFENMTRKFQFRGLDDPSIYYTDDYRRAVQNHRNNFNSLATALLEEGDSIRAREVLLFSLDKMPDKGVRYDVTALQTFQLLLALNEKERAHEIANTMGKRADELVAYYLKAKRYGQDFRLRLAILGELARIYYLSGDEVRGTEWEKVYTRHAEVLQMNRQDM